MNTIIKTVSVVILSLFVLSGCVTTGQPILDPNYAAYVQTIQAYANREQQPMVDIELTEDGKLKAFKVYKDNPIPRIEQARPKPPSPGWKIANTAMRMLGWFGLGWVITDGLTDIVNSISGQGQMGPVIGSYNGGDVGVGIERSWNTQSADGAGVGESILFGDVPDNSVDNTDNSVLE